MHSAFWSRSIVLKQPSEHCIQVWSAFELASVSSDLKCQTEDSEDSAEASPEAALTDPEQKYPQQKLVKS